MWPKNFVFLATMSALCEAVSVTLFKISGDRGAIAVLGYIFGFLVLAFYAESTRYAKIAQSYPVFLIATAVFISIASYIILHEKIKPQWFIGFLLVIVGLLIIQTSFPANDVN